MKCILFHRLFTLFSVHAITCCHCFILHFKIILFFLFMDVYSHVRLVERLTLWPLTNLARVRFLSAAREMVRGHQAGQVTFFPDTNSHTFLPTAITHKRIDLCQRDRSLISCCILHFSRCKIKVQTIFKP